MCHSSHSDCYLIVCVIYTLHLTYNVHRKRNYRMGTVLKVCTNTVIASVKSTDENNKVTVRLPEKMTTKADHCIFRRVQANITLEGAVLAPTVTIHASPAGARVRRFGGSGARRWWGSSRHEIQGPGTSMWGCCGLCLDL